MKNKKITKNILVISSYPVKGQTHGIGTVGVASYTKNLLLVVAKKSRIMNHKSKIMVFAEKLNNKSEEYKEGGIKVKRIWQRNNVFSFLALFLEVLKSDSKIVLTSYERNMLGGIIANVFFLSFLPVFSLFRKRTYFIMHQVVEDFAAFEKNKVKAKVLNLAKNIFHWYICIFTYRIIVFEEKLAETLGRKEKIIVIPHAVEKYQTVDIDKASRKLGLNKNNFNLLYFGFLSPYKGVDSLIKSCSNNGNNNLIIAGGINPNHIKNKTHLNYISDVKKLAEEKNVVFTGFIDEKQIPLYFSLADVVVLPYKTFFSSSGPLSLAFSFKRAILISKPLKAYFKSKDFNDALVKSGLKKEDLIVDFETNLAKKIIQVKNKIKKYIQFSKLMNQKRSWENVGRKYLEVLKI